MPQPLRRKPRNKGLLAEEYEYVEDFGEQVRRAREKMGLSQEELAALVKEKATVIRKIEQGVFHPPIELARRLEKALKITIVQEAPEEYATSLPKASKPQQTGYTLEDVLKKSGQTL
ncbi:MAG: multiprotein-bridging factor 1 family protein [Aigarchaeota archaeon]|nr:multiprotein-bridging factor 1 family protein [Candidatus Pelearchaeum maunauluense]